MVQSVDRTLDILEQLVTTGNDLSVSELGQRLDLPLGTVHRLLNALVKRGYAAQDAGTRRYGPGPRLLEIGARAMSNERFSLQRSAHGWLEQLTAQTGETSNLVVLQGQDGVYLDQVASAHLVRMFTEIGQRAPLYCTGAGKAILSGFKDEQLNSYLANVELRAWTPHTIRSRAELGDAVLTARERGYATDDEERELGVRCVAAPLFDQHGVCIAALSISGPITRLTAAVIDEIAPLVRDAATACSATLGHGLVSGRTGGRGNV